MRRLTFDELQRILPDLEELRPLRNAALQSSEPDAGRVWIGSGELDHSGQRLVRMEVVARASEPAAEAARMHLRQVFAHVGTALERAQEGDAAGAAQAFLAAAATEERAGRPERAMAYAEAAHGRLENERSRQGRELASVALRRWARAARSMGDHERASLRYRDAHGIASATGDHAGAAEAAIGAGNVLEDQGRWREAEGWYRKALAELDRLPDLVPERWHAALNLHITLRSCGAVEESLPWLEAAAATAEGLGDVLAPAFIENAWGQLRMAADRPEEALEHFHRALEGTSGAYATVTVRLNLAEALLALGRTRDGAEQVRISEQEAIVDGVFAKLPEVYRMLARAASELGNADAFVLFERSLELATRGGDEHLQTAQTLQAYAEAEAEAGRPDAAQQLLARAATLYASLGASGMRRRWVDVFDRPSAEGHPHVDAPTTHEPGSHHNA